MRSLEPIAVVAHLWVEILSYHSSDHSHNSFSFICSFDASSLDFTIVYSLISSTYSWHVQYLSLTIVITALIYNRKRRGPRTLPWTTPLMRNALLGSTEPTLICCERSLKKFFIHNSSKLIRPNLWLLFKSNCIANLQQTNNKRHFAPRRARTDIILTAGGKLQSLNAHNSSKATRCSDELTCCNAYHSIRQVYIKKDVTVKQRRDTLTY